MLARIDAAGIGPARRFEHPRRAERRDRDALGGLGDHLVHVGHRREVEHRTAALERVGERVLVEEVDLDPLGFGLQRRALVEDAHRVTGVEQRVDDVRADESRSAGYGDGVVSHRASWSGIAACQPAGMPLVTSRRSSRPSAVASDSTT